MEVLGKTATVIGYGIEGKAVTEWLVAHGARVTVSDAKGEQAFRSEQLEWLRSAKVTLALGGNRPEDTINSDLLFVSQGVPLDIPAITLARAKGIPLSSLTHLFMSLCPGSIVGITGSAGKTTTTSLLGEIFRACSPKVLVGGNIGIPLLDQLDQITQDTIVILEVSHTQLELVDKSPTTAVVTNIAPSHADRYPNLEDYVNLKKRIFLYQDKQDSLVLNYDDPITRAMAPEALGRCLFFSRQQGLKSDEGAYIKDDEIYTQINGVTERWLSVQDIKL
ncbi:MAG: Mur ligase family protein, partial [Candidatus Daviesbacteria bacterium]|nr:Mur ligase family protein [Candidatus Daviesbacteria bacterium]